MSRALAVVVALAGCRGGAEPAGSPSRKLAAAAAPGSTVKVSGRVIDQIDRKPVAGVRVVLRDALADHTATSSTDGSFTLAVARGSYRAFVIDASVMSVGVASRARLESGPRAALAGAPDDDLLPMLAATEDVAGIELPVVHGGVLSGTVVDRDNVPVANAIVRARGVSVRPVLGSDVGASGVDGRYELRVAPGRYALDVSHPRFATTEDTSEPEVIAGNRVAIDLQLAAGCVVTGRVLAPDGTPSADGAIERGDARAVGFGPSGRIEPDGSFRWTTTDEREVALRAWPWRSAPSEEHRFACKSGARFGDVVFHVPAKQPDLDGTIVDAAGAPIPLAAIDVKPLDDVATPQQERADATGHWQVYSMPPGRYEVSAAAPGRGIVVATAVAPRDGLRLQLGGTGRIEGTVTGMAAGSFLLAFDSCSDVLTAAHQPMALAREPQIVIVRAGRFVVDRAPACHLTFLALAGGEQRRAQATVSAGSTVHVELALGAPREKTVRGTLHDSKGVAVAGAHVTAMQLDALGERKVTATTRSDDSGRYTLHTNAGANLVASEGNREAKATVGLADVPAEELDLVLAPRATTDF